MLDRANTNSREIPARRTDATDVCTYQYRCFSLPGPPPIYAPSPHYSTALPQHSTARAVYPIHWTHLCRFLARVCDRRTTASSSVGIAVLLQWIKRYVLHSVATLHMHQVDGIESRRGFRDSTSLRMVPCVACSSSFFV